MLVWTRITRDWLLKDRKLNRIGLPGGVWTLKTLFALTIAKGEYFSAFDQGDDEYFPAALSELTDRARLRRNHAHAGLTQLLELGIVERIPAQYFHGRTRHGTAVYNFCGPSSPWMPIPFRRLRDFSPLLPRIRTQTRTALVALKLLLVFCALRDRTDHCAWVSYDKLTTNYGMPRADIRPALDILIDSKMVHVYAKSRDGVNAPNSYCVLGLDGRAPLLAEDISERIFGGEA